MRDISAVISFGEWIRRRRQFLDLTQATLARRVGCAAITIRKIESDERRPSRQLATRLALFLAISEGERERFVAIALGEQSIKHLSEDFFLCTSPLSNPLSAFKPAEQSDNVSPLPRPMTSRSFQGNVTNDEIRVVTVVAAGISDVAEKRLSQHPDDSAELMQRAAALIGSVFAELGIYMDESLEGHPVALFGAPQLHEDDPERAVYAAMQIQSAAQALGIPIAIGLHLGPVYLNQNNQAHANSVVGATVSFARRLQRQAGDGQIVVSKTVYRQSRRAFDFQPWHSTHEAPTPDLQPISEAVYLLLRPRQSTEKSRGIEGYQPSLIGRERELAMLEGLVKALELGNGAKGSVVILSGEAGVGKSTLLAQLKGDLSTLTTMVPPLLWLEGRCLETTMGTGYGPFLDFLRVYFAWQPEDNEAARVERLLRILNELAAGGQLSTAQIEKIGPLLGNLFSLHFGNEWDEKLLLMPPEVIRLQTFQAIYELLVAVARRQPLLLVFEDLHWADGASLDLIGQLMEAVPLKRLLLLCVCRPEQNHRSNQLATVALHKCPGQVTEIALRELSPQQSRQLLSSLLGAAVPDKVANLILTRAQGNPFFIEELVYSLISMDLLYQEVYQEENRWWARPNFDEAIVPDTIQSLFLSRVDRLAPAQKIILHHAAVIGRYFSLPVLALMMASYREMQIDYDEVLWQLEEQALIYQERALPEAIYVFRHILIHEAIYATIPRRRAKALHGRVAQVLEEAHADELAEYYEPLAYHYDHSEDASKAVEYLLKAAQKAQRAYLNEEAIAYYTKTLLRLDELPVTAVMKEQRLVALTDLGQVYYHGVSQLEQAEITLRQALALGKEMDLPPRRLAKIMIWLGDLLMNWQPRYDQSLSLGKEALELLGNDNLCNEAAMANGLIYFSYLMTGNFPAAKDYALRSTAFVHLLPCTEDLDHLIYLAMNNALVILGRLDEAKWWLELSIQHAERGQHRHALAEATMGLAHLLMTQGDIQAARVEMQKAKELMLQAGDLKRVNWCQMAILWFCLQLGDLEAFSEIAVATYEQAQALNQEYLPDLPICLGIAALAEGAWQDAEKHFRDALHGSEVYSQDRVEAQLGVGYALLAQDKVAEAIALLKSTASAALRLPDFVVRPTKGTRENYAPLLDTLNALNTLLDDATMDRVCASLRAEGRAGVKSRFAQWFLQRSEIDPNIPGTETKLFVGDWQWSDPFGGCTLICDSDITIHAANGGNVWFSNNGAPRLMHSIAEDFVLQTHCEVVASNKPAIGGILLWHSLLRFMRLDWGSRGMGQIALMGSIDIGVVDELHVEDVVAGRGRLNCQQPYLRLERKGDLIRALCSADGEDWFKVGQVEFPASDPLEVGLYASGWIDRLVYHGRYPDGTAIRFTDTFLRSS